MKYPKLYANKIKTSSIDLTLSENPLGCSPLVTKVLKKLRMKDVSKYPDLKKLKISIANRFNIPFGPVVLGCGSEQLIKLIAQTFIKKSSLVLIQKGSFPLFLKESLLAGGRVSFMDSIEALNPDVVFIANPNNTNGEIVSFEKIKALIKNFPSSIIVIDEAGGEFLRKSFVKEAIKSKNCIVLRSMSKVSGLAGLRIGFALGAAQIIKQLNNSQQPFPISSISVKLAIESFKDDDFVNKSKLFFAKERKYLKSQLKNLGFDYSKSVTNNLFIESKKAKTLESELLKNGVSVIDSSFFPGISKPGFRISIKDSKTNQEFIKILNSIAIKY